MISRDMIGMFVMFSCAACSLVWHVLMFDSACPACPACSAGYGPSVRSACARKYQVRAVFLRLSVTPCLPLGCGAALSTHHSAQTRTAPALRPLCHVRTRTPSLPSKTIRMQPPSFASPSGCHASFSQLALELPSFRCHASFSQLAPQTVHCRQVVRS